MIIRLGASWIAAVLLALAVAAAGSSSTARVKHLQAWAAQYRHPPVGVSASGFAARMRVVKHVAPGRYRIHVIASDAIGFDLVGPGVNRHTRVTLTELPHLYTRNTTWTLTLRRGVYNYRAIGQYAANVRPALGSFRVP